MADEPKRFFWYELMTTDVDAAVDFYAAVVGWTPREMSGGMRYAAMHAGEAGVAGIMRIPEEPLRTGMRPVWLGYIRADDVDAAAAGISASGGTVHRPPSDIPGVGRFAVVADPQGAMFQLLAPIGEDVTTAPAGTPGHVGWHELFAQDWSSAFDFYAGQFGWTKDQAIDMGPMGTYQLFAAGGPAIGGMMNKPGEIPVPHWQFYFNVLSIDAAAARVTEHGGQIAMGPHEVPGGAWVLQCRDPQGAGFALLAPVK